MSDLQHQQLLKYEDELVALRAELAAAKHDAISFENEADDLRAELAREKEENKSNLELVIQVETLRTELAAVREGLEDLIDAVYSGVLTDIKVLNAADKARTALQSHRRTEP